MKYLLMFLSLVLAGCAAPNQLMIQPSTGNVIDCSTWGWGWAGTPMALINHEQCIKRYRGLGYMELEKYKAQGGRVPKAEVSSKPSGLLKITSEPSEASIWTSQNNENWQFVGYTPFEKTLPPNSSHWIAECYKVKKEGYKEKKECRPVNRGNRLLHFNLDPKKQ